MTPSNTRSVLLGTLLSAFWLMLSGHWDVRLLLLGLLSVVVTVWMARRMGIDDAEGLPVQQLPRLIAYLPWLARAVVASNIDVARRVVTPSLPIEPVTVRVHADQKTAVGRVVYANSITLTPGTITLEVEENSIEVHALTGEGARDLCTNEMGRRVTACEAL